MNADVVPISANQVQVMFWVWSVCVFAAKQWLQIHIMVADDVYLQSRHLECWLSCCACLITGLYQVLSS